MADSTAAITLAMTGASGAQYAFRLLEALLAANCDVALLISRAAEVVIATETDIALPNHRDIPDANALLEAQTHFLTEKYAHLPGRFTLYGREDWFSPVASGSSSPRQMVICPASGGSLGAIATGASNNLIERAADVALKERRPLILVPREAPYSQVHLENMLKLTQMGATILPASPGFYQRPHSIHDLIDFVVARILDQLKIPQSLLPAWGEP